jgi:fructose-specific phosphotransferase system IIC component
LGKNKNKLGNNKYFDPRMGLIGGTFMATIVFFINVDHGIVPGMTAALKQGLYTFLAGGIMMRICENIAAYFSNDVVALFLAVLVPGIIAVSLTYLLHSLKGTPEPLNSTIPTMFLAPMGFLWWATRKRKQLKTIRD